MQAAKIKDHEDSDESKREFITPALDCCFGKRLKNADEQEVSNQILGLLIILSSFVQQLSLLVFDGLEFGLWGDIFGNINVFTLNIGNPLDNIEGEVLYMLAVFNFPFLLFLWYALACFNRRSPKDPKKFPKVRIISWIVFIVSLITASVIFIVVNFAISLIVAFPAIFILVAKILILVRSWLLRDKYDVSVQEGLIQKVNFHTNEYYFVEFLTVFITPIVASVYVNVALLNENQAINIIFGIYGGIVLTILLARLYLAQVLKNYSKERGFINTVLEKVVYQFLFLQKEDIQYTDAKMYREKFELVPLAILAEKIILASLPVYIAGIGNETALEVTDYTIIFVIFATFIFFAGLNPFKAEFFFAKRAEVSSRLSNILIFTFAVVNTRLIESESDIQEDFELYGSIIMIGISLYMLVFWLRLFNLKVLVSWLVGSLINYYKAAQARRTWRNVDSLEAASNIILNRKNQEVTIIEWNNMTYLTKLYTACVERTLPVRQNDKHLTKLSFKGHLSISYNLAESDYAIALRKHGFGRFTNATVLLLNPYADTLIDLRVLIDSGMIKKLNAKGLTGFDIHARKLSEEDFTFLMDTLTELENEVEYLRLSSIFSEKFPLTQTNFEILLRATELTSLKKIVLNQMKEEKIFTFMKALLKNLRFLEFCNLKNCGLTDEFFPKFYNLIENQEKAREGCQLKTLILGYNNFSSNIVKESIKFLLKSKCVENIDISHYGSRNETPTNEMFEFCQNNPGKIIFSGKYFLKQTDELDVCNVYLASFELRNFPNEMTSFFSEKKLNLGIKLAVRKGVCRGFAYGITLLTENHKETLMNILENDHIMFLVDKKKKKKRSMIQCSIPEAILRVAEKSGKHAAYALMVMNRDLGVNYAELTRAEEEDMSLLEYGKQSKNEWVKRMMDRFVARQLKGEKLTEDDYLKVISDVEQADEGKGAIKTRNTNGEEIVEMEVTE